MRSRGGVEREERESFRFVCSGELQKECVCVCGC